MKTDDYMDKEKLRIFRDELKADLDQIDCALLITQCFFRRLIPIDNISRILLEAWKRLAPERRSRVIQAFYNYLKARPEKTKAMTMRMLDHMADGKSSSDPNAAGGWNRAEFGEFLVFLQQSRF